MPEFNQEFFENMDDQEFTASLGGSSDAAFLFVLITFQFMVTCFGLYTFYHKLFGDAEYKKRKKVTSLKLCIQLFLIALNLFWMYHTYSLIQMDKEIQASNWDPYTALGLEPPKMMG